MEEYALVPGGASLPMFMPCHVLPVWWPVAMAVGRNPQALASVQLLVDDSKRKQWQRWREPMPGLVKSDGRTGILKEFNWQRTTEIA